jgi:predicted permease
MVAKYQGVEALRAISRADKTLYLGFAMVASGILSAITWSSVLPDRRDSLVLGVLPVRPASIIGAKLAAVAAYVVIVSVAMHALASVSFGFFLAAENTAGFLLRGIAAHFVASSAASAFVCLAIVAVQGVALVVAGPRRFLRVSTALQTVLVGIVLIGLVTLPSVSRAVVDTLAGGANARPWILNMPPLWFLGVYEWVLGAPGHALQQLALTAVAMLAAVVVTMLVTYPIACRRLLVDAVERAGGFGRVGRTAGLARLVVRLSGYSPEVRAVSQHLLATIGRVGQHRFVMAMAIGAAMAWGLPAWMSVGGTLPAAPSAGLLSLPITAMLFVLLGFRIAATLPSELGAAWLFETYVPARDDIHQALERTMLLAGVGPIVFVSTVASAYFWGWRTALVHAGCAAAIGAVLTQALLWRFDVVPCATPWQPAPGHLRKWWPAYLIAFSAVARGLPAIEALVLAHPAWASVFVPYLAGFAWWIRRHSLDPPPARDGDSAVMITAALRAGRGIGELAADEPPRLTRRAAPTLAAFEALGVRDRREERWFDGMLGSPRTLARDVHLAVRRLIATPVFTLFAMLSIGLGIGATTATYSVFRSLVWSQPAVQDIDRLMAVNGTIVSGRGRTEAWAWPDFVDLQAAQRSFSGFAASTALFELPLIGGDVAMPARGEAVNGDYFKVLGVTPIAGRLIQPHDDRPDATPAIVLNGGVWRKYFAGDRTIVGKTITLDGRAFEVIGIAPGNYRALDFSVIDRPAMFWVPLRTAPVAAAESAVSDDRSRRRLVVKGRLAPGVDSETASSEVHAIGRRIEEMYPSASDEKTRGRRWGVTPSTEYRRGWWSTAATCFVGAVALVLLIACTNLANLAVARGVSRQHDLAVRKALGASRGRLVREQLIETGLVGVGGAAIGWLALNALIRWSTADVPIDALILLVFEPQLNTRVLLLSAVLSLLALGIVGVWPALQLSRTSVRDVLAIGAGAVVPPWKLHRRFIAWQVAGTVALLLMAVFFVRALVDLRRGDTGVNMDRVAIVRFELDPARYDDRASRDLAAQMVASLERQPGVDSVAVSSGLPFGTGDPGRVAIAPAERRPELGLEPALTVAATPGLFSTLGIRILRGRGFDDRDTVGQPDVAVINEASARRVFGTPDVVGRELALWSVPALGKPTLDRRLTIVGVSSDSDVGRRGSRAGGIVYMPIEQRPSRSLVLTVSTAGRPADLTQVMRAAIRRLAPEAVMRDIAGSPAGILGFVGSLASGLAGIALLLAMTGLYGVMTLLVSRRVREMGVRLALGASRDRIFRLILVDGLRPVLSGIGLGLALALIGRPIVQSAMGAPVAPIDPIAFALVPIPLVVAAIIACYVPARRASRVEPARALRSL